METSEQPLLTTYYDFIERENFVKDFAQDQAIQKLNSILEAYQGLQEERSSWWAQLRQNWSRKTTSIQGLYLWGGVGRGKTFLVDLFFEALPTDRKRRLHFHRFMYEVHQALQAHKGVVNPLKKIAKEFAEQYDILCFDEFFVSDITDAMLLAGLLDELFKQGLILIATSNVVPDNLYKNGLQRSRFLAAIQLLKEHCEIFELAAGADYRLQFLEQAEIFHTPLDAIATENMKVYFAKLCPDQGHWNESVELANRQVDSVAVGDGVVWFEFRKICGDGRSQNDYIELAYCYQTVMVSDVPQFDNDKEDSARRFISLVDELYDHNVKLILSAETSLTELYQGQRLRFEFQRTQSRLIEMQSTHYLAREHQI